MTPEGRHVNFARDPFLSYFDEPQKSEIYFLSTYEGHPINSENLSIILCIESAYRKYNLSVAYLVAHKTKHPKL